MRAIKRNKVQMISKELELRSAFHKYFVEDLAKREVTNHLINIRKIVTNAFKLWNI